MWPAGLLRPSSATGWSEQPCGSCCRIFRLCTPPAMNSCSWTSKRWRSYCSRPVGLDAHVSRYYSHPDSAKQSTRLLCVASLSRLLPHRHVSSDIVGTATFVLSPAHQKYCWICQSLKHTHTHVSTGTHTHTHNYAGKGYFLISSHTFVYDTCNRMRAAIIDSTIRRNVTDQSVGNGWLLPLSFV